MTDKDYGLKPEPEFHGLSRPEPEPSDEDIEKIADEAADEARAEMEAEEKAERESFQEAWKDAEASGMVVNGKLDPDKIPEGEDEPLDAELPAEELPGPTDEEVFAEADAMLKASEDDYTRLVGQGGIFPEDYGERPLAEMAGGSPAYQDPERDAELDKLLEEASDPAGADHAAQTDGRLDQVEAMLAGLVNERKPDRLVPEGLENFFFARITDSTIENGTATGDSGDPTTKWSYAWSEVYKEAEGYGGWTVDPNGREGTSAFNYIEDINTTTGADTMGNGVQLSHLDYDGDSVFEFTPRPVPDNVVVQMRVVEFTVSNVSKVEYWFAYENAGDGVCD